MRLCLRVHTSARQGLPAPCAGMAAPHSLPHLNHRELRQQQAPLLLLHHPLQRCHQGGGGSGRVLPAEPQAAWAAAAAAHGLQALHAMSGCQGVRVSGCQGVRVGWGGVEWGGVWWGEVRKWQGVGGGACPALPAE